MTTEDRAFVTTPAPGLGRGWMRIAEAVGQTVSPEEITGVWVFSPLRQEGREWGTAVVARRAGEGRVAVFTARYMLSLRGRERGQGRVEVEEVGESPVEVMYEVLRGVQHRAGEAEPPVEISPKLWYGGRDDESASES